MPTIRQLITSSLRLLNVVQEGESPSDNDISISLSALNSMIDSWSTERLGIYTVSPTYVQAVANKATYTLGAGGDWNKSRPMQILNAQCSLNSTLIPASSVGDFIIFEQYITNPSTLDMPMEILTDQQWSSIKLKSATSTFPTKLYDNGDYPQRQITLWPVPNQNQVIILWLWTPLANKSSLDAELNLPKGYERALKFNLAVEISAEFGKAVPDGVIKIAGESKAVIKRLNIGPQYLMGDIALSSQSPSILNNISGFTGSN